MTTRHDRSSERRWIVLDPEGRHISLGRSSDPTEEEILAAERALAAKGVAGWLAIMHGDYWSQRETVAVLMVKPLAGPLSEFDEAVAALNAHRTAALNASSQADATAKRAPKPPGPLGR